MGDTVDLVNRDPNGLNDHCRANFEDVLAEPENPRSIDCVWRNASRCFQCGVSCCYKFLTVLCALPLALLWGCSFSMIVCAHVWCVTPLLNCVRVNAACLQRFWGTAVVCCCAPVCEIMGLIFHNIQVRKAEE